MARRLRWNADVLGLAERVLPVVGRAESFGIPAQSLVHIDPDRRASPGRRARSIVDYAPGVETLRRLIRETAGGAIKLGPASDFGAHFDASGLEIELISLDGECREATVWFGSLASCRRRATCLPEGATWTEQDAATGVLVPRRAPSRFVASVDPALSRAGLAPGFAAAHGLSQVAQQANLLTAEVAIASPFLTWFEVIDLLPFDRRSLKSRVHAERLGPLEIKVLGVRVSPESLRAELRPPGPHPSTLLLYPDGKRVNVIIARRL